MANNVSFGSLIPIPSSQQIWDTVSDWGSSIPFSTSVRPFVNGLYQCCDSSINTNSSREVSGGRDRTHETKVTTVSNRVIEIKRNPVEEEHQKEERKIQELREEVEKLRTMKMKLEAFVAARPKLQEECSKALEKNPEGINTLTPVSLNGVSEKARLLIEKTHLRYDLEVRIRFITAYKDLYDSFKEHLEQEGLQEIEWSNYGK